MGSGDVTILAGYIAIAYEGVEIQLLHGLSIGEKMERGIDMGAVVGAHGKGGKVIQIPPGGGAKGLLFRRGVAGIDPAGEDFLRNIVQFHRRHLLYLLYHVKTTLATGMVLMYNHTYGYTENAKKRT
jgi:hypothetical protein